METENRARHEAEIERERMRATRVFDLGKMEPETIEHFRRLP